MIEHTKSNNYMGYDAYVLQPVPANATLQKDCEDALLIVHLYFIDFRATWRVKMKAIPHKVDLKVDHGHLH